MNFIKWLWKHSRWILNEKGGIFDFIGDLFGGKDERLPSPQRIEPEFQQQMRGLIEQYARGESPYADRRRSYLEQYLGDEGIPPLTQAAETEVSRTLGGYYEPYVGKAYEPFRRQTLRELEEAKSRLGRSATLAGMRTSTPFLGIESDLEAGTLDTLMSKLASLFETERGRKFQAVPLASEMGRYRDPLTKAGALTEFEERPLQYAMNLLSGYQPSYYQPQYRHTPGLFETGAGFLSSYLAGGGPLDFWNIGKGQGSNLSLNRAIYGAPEQIGSYTGYRTSGAGRRGGFLQEIEPLLQTAKLAAILGG